MIKMFRNLVFRVHLTINHAYTKGTDESEKPMISTFERSLARAVISVAARSKWSMTWWFGNCCFEVHTKLSLPSWFLRTYAQRRFRVQAPLEAWHEKACAANNPGDFLSRGAEFVRTERGTKASSLDCYVMWLHATAAASKCWAEISRTEQEWGFFITLSVMWYVSSCFFTNPTRSCGDFFIEVASITLFVPGVQPSHNTRPGPFFRSYSSTDLTKSWETMATAYSKSFLVDAVVHVLFPFRVVAIAPGTVASTWS